jgi:hypothetical protein
MILNINNNCWLFPYTWEDVINKLPLPDTNEKIVKVIDDNITYKFVLHDYKYKLVEINDINNEVDIYITISQSYFIESHYVKSVIHKKILTNVYLDEHVCVIYDGIYLSFNPDTYGEMNNVIDSLFKSVHAYVPPFDNMYEIKKGITTRTISKVGDIITYCSISGRLKTKVVFDKQGPIWGVRFGDEITYIIRYNKYYYIGCQSYQKISSPCYNTHLVFQNNRMITAVVDNYKFYTNLMFEYKEWCYDFHKKYIKGPDIIAWPRPLVIDKKDIIIKLMNDGRIIQIQHNSGEYVFQGSIIRHGNTKTGLHYWSEKNGDMKYELNCRSDHTYEFRTYSQGIIQGYYLLDKTTIIQKIIYEGVALKYAKINNIISMVL